MASPVATRYWYVCFDKAVHEAHGVGRCGHINPVEAASRNIADGDLVEVYNERGRLISAVVVSNAIMPGVLRLSAGAWFDMDHDSGIERHGNPNAVTLDMPASSLSQGCSAQTCLVDIRRLDPKEARAVLAFEPPQFQK